MKSLTDLVAEAKYTNVSLLSFMDTAAWGYQLAGTLLPALNSAIARGDAARALQIVTQIKDEYSNAHAANLIALDGMADIFMQQIKDKGELH